MLATLDKYALLYMYTYMYDIVCVCVCNMQCNTKYVWYRVCVCVCNMQCNTNNIYVLCVFICIMIHMNNVNATWNLYVTYRGLRGPAWNGHSQDGFFEEPRGHGIFQRRWRILYRSRRVPAPGKKKNQFCFPLRMLPIT